MNVPPSDVSSWLLGFVVGFRLIPKLPVRIRKVYCLLALVLTVLSLLPRPSAFTSSTHQIVMPKAVRLRSLGTIIAPPKFRPLRQIQSEEKREQQQREKRERVAIHDNANNFVTWTWSNVTLASTGTSVTTSGSMWNANPFGFQPTGKRKGPFCRITCTVHHDDHYDVEVESGKVCKDNVISPDAETVMGWFKTADERFEALTAWPGPAIKGFHSYKLYWAEK